MDDARFSFHGLCGAHPGEDALGVQLISTDSKLPPLKWILDSLLVVQCGRPTEARGDHHRPSNCGCYESSQVSLLPG